MDDEYYSIIREASQEIRVKSSRFIGQAKAVNTVKQAGEYINLISTQNFNATHNCMAYKVGIGDKALYKYNDDGEPGGTGGRPILEAIEAQELTNIVTVVTRYFGGIKLGTGGLSRAYRNCAEQTLQKAGKKKFFLTVPLVLNFSYDLTGIVMEIVEKSNCRIVDKQYGAETELTVRIKKSQSHTIKQLLLDKASGKIIIKEGENEFN